MARSRPVVGIICDHRRIDEHSVHIAGEKYIAALRDGSNAIPLLIPARDPPLASEDILASVDGLMFPGSPSNVAPRHYGGEPPREPEFLDEQRDANTLPLLISAIQAGKPVLCVCRGFQELNVALGGTLHQHVHEVEGRRDHREDESKPLDMQYGPAHPVMVAEGGLLAKLVGARRFEVNSLHGQGIDRLAPGLFADARAPDGQIEAVSMPGARRFVLGLQWHPEWRWSENAVSRAIYAAFGAALQGKAA